MTPETAKWQDRIIERANVAPDQLLANPLNFRVHPKEQQDALLGGIEEIGFLRPVIVNKGTGHVIDGHLRVKLALRENQPTIPVDYVDLTEEQERIALATLDPITGMAVHDDEILNDLLNSIDVKNQGLIDFIANLRGETGLPDKGKTDEDDIPPKPASKVNPGDVWILGDHRLICGDATDRNTIDVLMAGEEADLVWTDPPYNVDYEGRTKEKLKIENDKMVDDVFRGFLQKAFGNMEAYTKEGGCIYIAHADSEGLNFRAAMEDSGWMVKQCLIWVKQSPVLSRQDYNWQHEPILYGWKPGAAHFFAGDFTLTTLIDDAQDAETLTKDELVAIINEIRSKMPTTAMRVNRPSASIVHPTMKPVALVRRCITASSRVNEIVLDGFGGSGTTLIACETIKRKARMVEYDPVYCDVIIQRWIDYTNEDAVLEESGVGFRSMVNEG